MTTKLDAGKKKFIGKRVGRLVVTGYSGQDDMGRFVWSCECDCGGVKYLASSRITAGTTRSCGCLRRDPPPPSRIHGESETKIYAAWSQIKQRCFNERNPAYATHGALGVKMDPAWAQSYECFKAWAISAGFFDGCWVVRKGRVGDYVPDNCVCVTPAEGRQITAMHRAPKKKAKPKVPEVA